MTAARHCDLSGLIAHPSRSLPPRGLTRTDDGLFAAPLFDNSTVLRLPSSSHHEVIVLTYFPDILALITIEDYKEDLVNLREPTQRGENHAPKIGRTASSQ